MAKQKKRNRVSLEPLPLQSNTKLPKEPRPPAINEGHRSWLFGGVDNQGPFAWDKFSQKEWIEIQTRLGHFEGMTPDAFQKAGCHIIDPNSLSQDAQKRLQKLKLDDVATLWSLRIKGKARVWAVQYDSIFALLWWDPNHQAYLVSKRNT